MYYTYVLQSQKDGKFYIGFTKELKLRLARLNAALQPSFAGFNWGKSDITRALWILLKKEHLSI